MLGASADGIKEMAGSVEPDHVETLVVRVEPENAAPVRLFRQMQTQWRSQTFVAGKHVVTQRTGFDYGALAPIAAGLGIALSETVMDPLREMEVQALAIHSRRLAASLRH